MKTIRRHRLTTDVAAYIGELDTDVQTRILRKNIAHLHVEVLKDHIALVATCPSERTVLFATTGRTRQLHIGRVDAQRLNGDPGAILTFVAERIIDELAAHVTVEHIDLATCEVIYTLDLKEDYAWSR